MSARELREPLKYSRSTRRRRSSGTVDLNALPPSESTDQAGSSASITAPNVVLPPSESRDQVGSSASLTAPNVQGGQSRGSVPPAPIDLDAIDDDVIISSPTAFAQAKNNSRTHGRAPVVDLESDDRPMLNASNRNKRRRVPPNQTVIICDSSAENDAVLYEMGSALLGLRALDRRIRPTVPQPPPPPPEPAFSCPICMGPLVEEMTTKCGHIFCKQCIKASISSQSKCPTCRRKVTMKDIIRVYLPTTK